MERSLFASRLAEASRAAVECARGFVEESLPEAVRFRVELNASYDGNPLHPDERVYPEDREGHPVATLERVDLDALASLLWREGAVPEWVDLSVESADEEATIVGVLACGRFTRNEGLLYHEREGRPPFHVLGPALPPESWGGDGERFSLWWTAHARNRSSLARAAEHADKVKILVASGLWCDDDALAVAGSFSRLVTLRLEDTSVVGGGLAHLTRCKQLEYLVFNAVAARPLDLSAMAALSTLTSVHVDGDPTDLVGTDRLGALRALTSLTLNLRALSSLAFVSGLGSLQNLGLDRTRIDDDQLQHLTCLRGLRTLSVNGTAVTDRGAGLLAKIPSLWRLWLADTQVSDVTLDAFATASHLDMLDVRGTRVTPEGVARLAGKRPDLRIASDG